MAQGAQQQQQADNAYAPIWIMILAAIVGYMIWYFGHTYIVAFVFKIKLLEAQVISLFSDHMGKAIAYLTNTQPSSVPFKQLVEVSNYIGLYIRYATIAVLGVLGVILYFSDVTLRYRKTYNMNKLREVEQVNWPQIMPVTKLDLVETDIMTGPWAMAMQPMDFARKHKLLKKDMLLSEMTRNTALTYSIKKGETKRVFTMQLGSYWTGPENLPMHGKVIYALLAAKLCRDKDGTDRLLLQINRSTATGKLNFSGAIELLNKHRNSEEVAKVIYRHAYTLTALASLLDASRRNGVFPTAEFLWLKPVDRSMWYMLNSVGRVTPHTEVAGPFAHWIAEKELGRKSMVPMVDEAVKAFDLAIKEVKILPEEYATFKEDNDDAPA